MQVIPTRSQGFAPVGRDNRKAEVISRPVVWAVCGSQGRKEKGEKFNISPVSNGWRHGIGKELKEKGTLCEVEEEGTAKSSGLLEIKVGH